MADNYQISLHGGVIRVLRNDQPDHTGIPENENNADWRNYQAWLGEGNTPLPAPIPPSPAAEPNRASTSSTTGQDTFDGGIGVNGAMYAGEEISSGVVTVSMLPSARGRLGARYFVVDANAAAFGEIVAGGGGSNKLPIYSDGADWRIG